MKIRMNRNMANTSKDKTVVVKTSFPFLSILCLIFVFCKLTGNITWSVGGGYLHHYGFRMPLYLAS